MQVIRHAKNIHEFIMKGKYLELAVLSDAHWDNPKSDQDLFKSHLDYCLAKNIPVMMIGDLFCLMQGRGDNRRAKSDIRPEHNNNRYLDSIVNTAVEWFKPYASIIKLIGYGNHETGVIKWQETDILRRFVDLLNLQTGSDIQVGGYGGWVIVRQMDGKVNGRTWRIRYFHGSGGGGVVTKGAINLTRALEMYEDFDCFCMGHIHENMSRNDVRDTVKHKARGGYVQEQKQIHLMITGTYKEEYGDGSSGWHVERGAPIKPLGGRILTMDIRRVQEDGSRVYKGLMDSHKFPNL